MSARFTANFKNCWKSLDERPGTASESHASPLGVCFRISMDPSMDPWMDPSMDPSMAHASESPAASPNTVTESRSRSRLADKSARLKARRARRREAHEWEMSQRIDQVVDMLRRRLEAFCVAHFVTGEARVVGTGAMGRASCEEQGPLGRGMAHMVVPEGEGEGSMGDAWVAFCRVCSRAGLDPLLLYHGLMLRNSLQAPSVGGLGEDVRMYEKYLSALSVVVLDVCDAQQNLTGGLCALETVVARVRGRGGSWVEERGELQVQEDVLRAVEAMRAGLDVVGLEERGFKAGGVVMSRASSGSVEIVKINGVAYVSTVDFVLDEECMAVLNVFEKAREGVTRREVMDWLGWREERVVDAMGKLMREGVVWLDLPPESMPLMYWCPSMS